MIPDSCRSNFQPFYLHPPHAILSLRSLSRRKSGREVAESLAGRLPFWASPLPSQARQCIRPYRVHHFLNYGLVVRFRLLLTPPLDDAVAFSYGHPVFCPTGTSTPLLVRTLRRTRGGAPTSLRLPNTKNAIQNQRPLELQKIGGNAGGEMTEAARLKANFKRHSTSPELSEASLGPGSLRSAAG
jgi:hypothetical protein